MIAQRIGSASGVDAIGNQRVVSVYRDGEGYKLCGPSGSCLVAGPLTLALQSVAHEFGLSKVEYLESRRA